MLKNIAIILIVICFTLAGCSKDIEKNYTENGEIKTEGKEMKTESGETKIESGETKTESGETKSENLETKTGSGEIKAAEEEKAELETELVQTSTNGLSNKKCAWGFRRMKENKQPEFADVYTKPLNQYQGIYVGNKEEKVIYLTFDEGYENGYTAEILDVLKEKDVPAIFFVTMPYVKQNKELVQRMIDEGHIVGNHTVNHPSMPDVLDDEKLKKEVMELHDYVKENFNYEMTFLRPPKGEYSERTVKICKDLGYINVLWSAAYDDWDVKKQDRLDYARSMIYNNLHNGSVMLLHAVSKDNTKLLPEIIDKIREEGYKLSSLEEFVY